MSIRVLFHILAGICGIVAAICIAIPSRNRIVLFAVFALIALIFEVSSPFLKLPLLKIPDLDCSITFLPSHYSPGLEVYGITWEKDFEEYQISFRNKSKTTDVYDLRLDIDLLGGIVKHKILAQQGCENLTIVPCNTEGGGIGLKNGLIVRTVKSYSNNLKINAGKLFPEGHFRLRLVLKIIPSIPKEEEGSGFFSIKYRYKDETGDMKKKSFAYKLKPKKVGSKSLIIDKENPIKGKHTRAFDITFAKPLQFRKNGSIEAKDK